jgi:hypothetical protein
MENSCLLDFRVKSFSRTVSGKNCGLILSRLRPLHSEFDCLHYPTA